LALPERKIEKSPAPDRAAVFLAWAMAAAALCSIAVSQSLLALALVALLFSRLTLRLPRAWLPLTLFLAATMVSLLFSGDMAAGRPQIRKLYVYLVLLVVYSAFRGLQDVRRLVLGWAAIGIGGAMLGFYQFASRFRACPPDQSFYNYYLADRRITGFASHWMTLSHQLMIVFLMLGAFLLFSPSVRKRAVWFGLAALALMGSAMVLSLTRSVWLGVACAALYLLWCGWRRLLLAGPVLIAAALLFAPVRARVVSAFQPSQADSNQHRIVCWRTGWEMIKAHPVLGLGPEMVNKHFMEYVPADIREKPLPPGWYGHLHSIYVHYAAERGLVGLALLLWFFGQTLWDFRRALGRLPGGRDEAKFALHGAVAVVIGIMVSGLFELNLGDSEVLMMFLAAVACGYAAVEKAKAIA
jgi:putative inorganic carbon (HCO3(-)) transporter